MYFTHAQTVAWSMAVEAICADHPATREGIVDLFVLPTFPSIPAVLEAMPGRRVGAQDLSAEHRGPFTGEVSGTELAEIGCTLVEIGHAERRQLYGETDAVVAAKTRSALRAGLEPIVCIGELSRGAPQAAIADTVAQVAAAIAATDAGDLGDDLVLAYEPVWAIGAPAPAEPEYIREVCRGIRRGVEALGVPSARLLYGGSARPGLLPLIHDTVDGMFLGRFAHDPEAVRELLDEAYWLATGLGSHVDLGAHHDGSHHD